MKWEYKIVRLTPKSNFEKLKWSEEQEKPLNDLGKLGWVSGESQLHPNTASWT